MNWKSEWKALAVIIAVFLAVYYLPAGTPRFDNAVHEALLLARWYAREHVLLCLIPAFFIAGAIGVFVSQNSVLRYLGPQADKACAYGVASCSGSILAVCSCTILPLFAGIYRMGAGIGPATAFLYSGPAINILAIVLTARVLGAEMGAARALGAMVFAVVIGLIMHALYRREEADKAAKMAELPEDEPTRGLAKNGLYFLSMIGILVFANWGAPVQAGGIFTAIYSSKWVLTAIFALGLAVILPLWFGLPWSRMALVALPTAVLALVYPEEPTIAFVAGFIGLSIVISNREDELGQWFSSSWIFARQILPLLIIGVLLAGLLLGRPGYEGLIPSAWVSAAVGGNSLGANFVASFAGAFMYFATLTEVPILQGLLGSGMGKGPALALLLAGPALSLPNMLVIRSIMGTQKTMVFVALVVVMATLSGMLYGRFWG